MYGAGDVRVENVPDATVSDPTDAVVRVARACICGSDLRPYASLQPSTTGQSMGHEAIGRWSVQTRAKQRCGWFPRRLDPQTGARNEDNPQLT